MIVLAVTEKNYSNRALKYIKYSFLLWYQMFCWHRNKDPRLRCEFVFTFSRGNIFIAQRNAPGCFQFPLFQTRVTWYSLQKITLYIVWPMRWNMQWWLDLSSVKKPNFQSFFQSFQLLSQLFRNLQTVCRSPKEHLLPRDHKHLRKE